MRPSRFMSKRPAFAAIDFETADYGRDSACALAIVHVRGSKIISKTSYLFRPPRRRFIFTYLHGISWEDVADQPTFGELWPEIIRDLSEVEFLVAHNASFDRAVLFACCESTGHSPPPLDFLCTVRVARHVWGFSPASLPHVCNQLGIGLRHHDPVSDAAACARILLAALESGWDLPQYLDPKKNRGYFPEKNKFDEYSNHIKKNAKVETKRLPVEKSQSSVIQGAGIAVNGIEEREVLLNSRQVAILLDMGPDEVVDLARRNRIPGMKIGRTWKFRKCDIEEIRKKLNP